MVHRKKMYLIERQLTSGVTRILMVHRKKRSVNRHGGAGGVPCCDATSYVAKAKAGTNNGSS